MKKLLILIALCALMVATLAAQTPEDACYQCHIENDLDEDLKDQLFVNYLQDVHFENGLGCHDCHGGDPEAFDDEDEAMWENDTYLGEVSGLDEIQMCSKCHSDPTVMREYAIDISTDQEAQYWTSKHGLELKKGNQKVATCTDCHSVHGIIAIDSPNSSVYPLNIPETCSKCHSSKSYMAGALESTDQYDDYVSSVHGTALLEKKDIYAPACNDCHGNHGAVPPTVGSIKEICGSCHAQNRDLFQESHLYDIFTKEGLPQCESCHGNHKILKPSESFLSWGAESVCIDCHEDGGKAKTMAGQLYQIIDSLVVNLDSAKIMVEHAEVKGMEVSDLYFNLEDAHNALIHTRTSVHSFDVATVRVTAAPGMAASEEAKTGAKHALGEFDYRRKGLFVASFIISLLALLVYLKVKQAEAGNKEE